MGTGAIRVPGGVFQIGLTIMLWNRGQYRQSRWKSHGLPPYYRVEKSSPWRWKWKYKPSIVNFSKKILLYWNFVKDKPLEFVSTLLQKYEPTDFPLILDVGSPPSFCNMVKMLWLQLCNPFSFNGFRTHHVNSSNFPLIFFSLFRAQIKH